MELDRAEKVGRRVEQAVDVCEGARKRLERPDLVAETPEQK